MRKQERESIKYLRNKGHRVETLHRSNKNHLIILVDDVKITISSSPSDSRGIKNTLRCITIEKNRRF